ncbi:MAG TPA: hypothetical protein VGR24_01010 [bacterium]|jgi:hypothetical protein|nr:hypothetical protein [bacterium]
MRILRVVALAIGVVATVAMASVLGYIAYVVRLWSKAMADEEIPRLSANG